MPTVGALIEGLLVSTDGSLIVGLYCWCSDSRPTVGPLVGDLQLVL